MEELALLGLLECPLCFKQLDASAKILPCQHTFCKACLQKRASSSSPLYCPECLTPTLARTVDELPAHLLLVRLVGGPPDPMGPDRSGHSPRYMVPLSRENPGVRESQQETGENRSKEQQRHKEVSTRALYQKDSLGELVLPNPAYTGSMRPKADENRNYGEGLPAGGRSSPAGAWLQGAAHQKLGTAGKPEVPALCRALQDFNPREMDLEDWKYCLGFAKADILTVIRRVDDHWIEARLGDKVGILPLQFVEPNSVAAKLLEGRSRKGSDTAELLYRTWNAGNNNNKGPADPPSPNRTAQFGAPQAPAPKTLNVIGLPLASRGKPPSISGTLYQSTRRQSTSTRNLVGYQGDVVPHQSAAAAAGPNTQGPAVPSSKGTALHVKRRSDTSHRHLAQGEKKMNSTTPPTLTMALVSPQVASSSAEVKNASTQQLSISVCAVLYSYKPRRPEELELRKGEMVGVYGRFNEGWLRGLSLRTSKVGILPANYVTPVLRTSAKLTETKAAPAAAASYNTFTAGKRPAAPKNPAVVLALDRVNADGTGYSMGQGPSVLNGGPYTMQSNAAAAAGRLSGVSQGWDTVRRAFNSHGGTPHRGNHYTTHASSSSVQSHLQNLKQVQVSSHSPVLQRKKHSGFLSAPGRAQGWMSEATAPSAADILNSRDFAVSYDAAFKQDRQLPNGPHSILVRPDSQKNHTEKPTKSVRFLTEEEFPLIRRRTSSWSSGNQIASSGSTGPPSLEVWAPSLTLGRDGPGIILKEGKAPVLRKGLEASQISDLNSNPQKQPMQSATSAQFSPTRHRVSTTYLAQEDSELSLLQGERVLVHRPRPDGRLLVTQESTGHTGLFHSSILPTLERLS
ncbi:unnamed protein product [Boreogadus saida]